MKRINALTICSDLGGCLQFRTTAPFEELKRFNVHNIVYAYLPTEPGRSLEDLLIDLIEPHDLIIVQRCYKYPLVKLVKKICDIVGKKMVFETDDDYLNLPIYNPCSEELKHPEVKAGFIEILKMADLVTVSTQELKNVYALYSKNIEVLPNNVRNVYYAKDSAVAEPDKDGKVNPYCVFGFLNVPKYIKLGNQYVRNIRIGYTATPTHLVDFNQIKYHLFKVLKRYKKNVTMIYIGDRRFKDIHMQEMTGEYYNMIHLDNQPYDLYNFNIRNFDIGLAPLVPDIFNMSKSPLKLLEYGSWGIPAVAPEFITYNREFTNGVNYLSYYNPKEFADQLCELIEKEELRERLGNAAREHVKENRLEWQHAEHRFNIYMDLINSQPGLRRFKPIDKALT